MNNHVMSINFMALGYRLAFIRIDDRLRLILLFTKIIWKLVNYIALPLFLGGILEKVKAAFYDGDSKKSVIYFVFEVMVISVRHKASLAVFPETVQQVNFLSRFFFLQTFITVRCNSFLGSATVDESIPNIHALVRSCEFHTVLIK